MQAISLEQLRVQLHVVYNSGKHAKKTLTKMMQMFSLFDAIPADPENGLQQLASTADLTTVNLSRFVKQRIADGVSANTINGELGYARTIVSYAIEEGYLQRPPNWRRLRLRSMPTKLNRPLTVKQATDLLASLRRNSIDWAGHRLYALYAVMLMTGCRRDEVLRAHVEDVDLERSVLKLVERRVRFKTAKSAKEVAIPPQLKAILREWLPRTGCRWLFPGVMRKGPWTGGSFHQRSIDQLQNAAEKIGIGHVTWHGLRHTFATHALVEFRVELWAVQRQLRHTDPRTTQKYLTVENAQPLIDRVSVIEYRQPA